MKKFYLQFFIVTILIPSFLSYPQQKKIKNLNLDEKSKNQLVTQKADRILNPPDLETLVLGGDGEDGGYNIHVTSDGGYIVAGCITTQGRSRDMVVYKLRSDLSLDSAFGEDGKWMAGSTGVDQAIDAIEVMQQNGEPDGYLVVGYTTVGDGDFVSCGYHGKNDIVVCRLTTTGQYKSSFGHKGIRLYGGSEDDMLIFHDSNYSEPGDHLVQTSGGFVISGITRSNDGDLAGISTIGWKEAQDVMIFKIDEHGDFVNDFGDRGILRIGNKPCPNMGKRHPHDFAWSLKADPERGFVASGFHFGMGLPIDGTMVLSPGSNTNIGDNTSPSVQDHKMDGWMFRFDEKGRLRKKWGDHGFVYLGGSRQEKLYDITPTSDGGYIICGRTSSSDLEFSRPDTVKEFDVVLVKVGKNGKLDHTFGKDGVCFLGGRGDQGSRVLTYNDDVLCLATAVRPSTQFAATIPVNYYHQILLVRLTPNGEPRRYWSLGKEGQDWPVGMTIDHEQRVVIVGYRDVTKVAEESGPKKSDGNRGRDLLVMRFNPTLN